MAIDQGAAIASASTFSASKDHELAERLVHARKACKGLRLPRLSATTSEYARTKETDPFVCHDSFGSSQDNSLSARLWVSPRAKKIQGSTGEWSKSTRTDSMRHTHSEIGIELRSPRRIPSLHEDSIGEYFVRRNLSAHSKAFVLPMAVGSWSLGSLIGVLVRLHTCMMHALKPFLVSACWPATSE
jgi:hypothetical protein